MTRLLLERERRAEKTENLEKVGGEDGRKNYQKEKKKDCGQPILNVCCQTRCIDAAKHKMTHSCLFRLAGILFCREH